MRTSKLVTLGMFAVTITALTFIGIAQTGNLFPTTSGSEMYQGGSVLTPASAGESFTAEANFDNSVAWSISVGGGSGNSVIYVPSASFEISDLDAGGGATTAGYALEVQLAPDAQATRALAAQTEFTESAGLAELDVSRIDDTTYEGNLYGSNGQVLIASFRFELTTDDLAELEGGESVTVDAQNNAGSGALNEISEATLTLAENGQVFIATINFTEFD